MRPEDSLLLLGVVLNSRSVFFLSYGFGKFGDSAALFFASASSVITELAVLSANR